MLRRTSVVCVKKELVVVVTRMWFLVTGTQWFVVARTSVVDGPVSDAEMRPDACDVASSMLLPI